MKKVMLSKNKILIIAGLILCFSFSVHTALALDSTSIKINEPTTIENINPEANQQFTPIGKMPEPEIEYSTITPIESIMDDQVNLTIDSLIDDKFSIIDSQKSPASCITPNLDGNVFTVDTTLCPGEYVYTGNGDYFIDLNANNITLDCDGAILSVSGGYGGEPAVNIFGKNNITIKNCIINNYNEPIIAQSSENSTISNITLNKGRIWISQFNNGEIDNLNKPLGSDNNISSGSLHLTASNYNNIHHNTIYGSYGLSLLDDSSFNLIHDNSFGYVPNTVPYPTSIYFGQGSSNNEFYSNEIINNSDTNVYGLIIYGENNPYYGNTTNNKIYNNTFSNNYVNLYMGDNATSNEVYNNTISNSIWNGILMWPYETTTYGWGAPHDNVIYDNYFSNGFRDIVITNLVNDNTFDNNTFNDTSDIAFFIYHSSSPSSKAIGNQFLNNHIIGTGNTGIEIHNDASQNHYFEGNHIKNRTNAGIIIGSGNDGGSILLNNFVNNAIQVTDNSNNIYDHIVGGNFWSDFDEPSEGCNDINVDGKCDQDYYGIGGTGGNIDSQPFTGAPTLEPIENISINELNGAIINIVASDPQGDELTYSIDNSDFFSITPCWPNKHAFQWITNAYSAGSYNVTATVSDGVHEISAPLNVSVANTCQINKKGVMECSSYYIPVACY